MRQLITLTFPVNKKREVSGCIMPICFVSKNKDDRADGAALRYALVTDKWPKAGHMPS